MIRVRLTVCSCAGIGSTSTLHGTRSKVQVPSSTDYFCVASIQDHRLPAPAADFLLVSTKNPAKELQGVG
jgi:hypothetical protein